MRRLSVALALVISFIAVPAARAQNGGEAGVFAHYFDFRQADTQLVGLGGRLSINTSPSVQFEGEIGYDFTPRLHRKNTPTEPARTISCAPMRACSTA
jgi:predicted acetyltransferase